MVNTFKSQTKGTRFSQQPFVTLINYAGLYTIATTMLSKAWDFLPPVEEPLKVEKGSKFC